MGLVATSNPHQITEGGRETSAVVGSTCFLRILTPQIVYQKYVHSSRNARQSRSLGLMGRINGSRWLIVYMDTYSLFGKTDSDCDRVQECQNRQNGYFISVGCMVELTFNTYRDTILSEAMRSYFRGLFL